MRVKNGQIWKSKKSGTQYQLEKAPDGHWMSESHYWLRRVSNKAVFLGPYNSKTINEKFTFVK